MTYNWAEVLKAILKYCVKYHFFYLPIIAQIHHSKLRCKSEHSKPKKISLNLKLHI